MIPFRFSIPFLLASACFAQDIPLTGFKGRDYGDWKASGGSAFEGGPARGETITKLEIENAGDDATVITSEMQGDQPRGTLASPEFDISRDFISYRIGGGDYERHTCMNLVVDGKIVHSATGRNSDHLRTASWDVRELRGKRAHIEVVDRASGQWGHVNVSKIAQTDAPEAYPITAGKLYEEALRPQFHFTARQWTMNRLNPGMRQEGWINDLNGMIYYDGEYHMFAQRWNKCWLHAVSKDLVHWEELEPAFWEDELDAGVQSGTCVIDYKNTSGLSPDPSKPPMIAFWSGADNKSQGMHYSLDHGRTWKAYEKYPYMVFPERDPKVFWYEPGKHWVMFLYGGGKYHILTSTNLLEWKDEKKPIADSYECPDFFELALDGDANKKKWVLVHADGRYSLGSFNGTEFKQEKSGLQGDINEPVFYATQSFANVETGDNRRIQMVWMRGANFPGMPFSQQISFPCELTLHSTPEGPRIFRKPVKEIEKLHAGESKVAQRSLAKDEELELAAKGELFHIKAEVEIPEGSRLCFNLRGVPLILTPKGIQVGNTRGSAIGKVESVEILLDRASMEAFVNEGEISSTNNCFPAKDGISVKAEGGAAVLKSVEVYELKSMWGK